MPPATKFPFKEFFRFFPREWFIVIIVALLLKLVAPGIDAILNFMINGSLTILFLRLSIIIHEAGHLLAAALVGGEPRRMILGIGHEIYRTEIYGIKVVLNSSPLGGLAIAKIKNEKYIKWRYAFYIAGGVLLNVFVAAIFYFIFGFDLLYLGGINGVDVTSAFIFTNAIKVSNLLPIYTSAYGSRLDSDGLTLMKLPFQSSEKFENIEFKNQFFDAYEYLEAHDYEKAHDIYKQYHEKFPEEPVALLNLAIVHLKQGHIDEAIKIIQPLVDQVESKKLRAYKGYIYNNVAWLYLLKEEIPQAYHYASLALKAMPKANYVWGTYGCILIEKGELPNGMQWLNQNKDLAHANNTTLAASIYLMLAHHQKNEFSLRDQHKDFVLKNLDKLERDDQILLKRNLEKIGTPLPPTLMDSTIIE